MCSFQTRALQDQAHLRLEMLEFVELFTRMRNFAYIVYHAQAVALEALGSVATGERQRSTSAPGVPLSASELTSRFIAATLRSRVSRYSSRPTNGYALAH